jgi:hypothetical protein
MRQGFASTAPPAGPGQRHLKRKATVAFLASCVALLLAAGPAPAQGLLDANCPGPPNTSVDPDPGDRDVQTFTAQRTGSLVRGETEISKLGGAADWVMQIVTTDGSGTPTNNVLASTTIANASVPDGDSRIVGLFAPPASVVAGQQFGLLIARPGESYTLRDQSNAPCPGQEFFSASGGPFMGEPIFDFDFAVFVDPTNAFTLGKAALNKKKGTATLNLTLPNPGDLTGSGNGAKVSSTRAVTSKSVGAGQAQLLIKAKGTKKRKLNETGKVKVAVAVTYTPTGGDPNTQSVKVKLKKKLKR